MLRSPNLHLTLASLSLTAAGAAVAGASLLHALLAMTAAALLVGFAYRFNRITDAAEAGTGRPFDLRHAAELAVMALALLLVLAPLPVASWAAAGGIAALGLVYSSTWVSRDGARRRPKNVLVLKNVMVGSGWALLLVLGAGRFDLSWLLVAFVGAQVFIGSIVRDVADVADDRLARVRTLPVVLGADTALRVLEALNLATVPLLIMLAVQGRAALAMGLLAAIIWRAVSLSLTRNAPRPWLLQAGTLATCHCIFFGTVVGTWS